MSYPSLAVVYYHFRRRRGQYLRRERAFRDIDNPIDYLDDDIIAKYRLPRFVIFDLCRRFYGDLKRPTLRSRSLQVTTALRFYAKGSFQAVTADVHGLFRE